MSGPAQEPSTRSTRSIDGNTAVPAYVQVSQEILREIRTNGVEPGRAIPSEVELTRRFGVSRVTIRRAVEVLIDAGIVERQHGRGTFVKMRPLDYPLENLAGTTQILRDRGYVGSSEVLESRAASHVEKAVLRALNAHSSRDVHYFRRLDSVNGTPVAVADIYLARALLKVKLARHEVQARPLYEVLESAGINVTTANQTIRAIACDDEIAGLLNLRSGVPVFLVERLARTATSEPVEYSRVHLSASAFQFSVSLHRPGGDGAEFPLSFDRRHLGS